MPRKKQKTIAIPRLLLLTCVITGIATLVLQMANRRMKITELGEIAGYVGTVFVICLLIIIGIFAVRYVNKK